MLFVDDCIAETDATPANKQYDELGLENYNGCTAFTTTVIILIVVGVMACVGGGVGGFIMWKKRGAKGAAVQQPEP